MTTPTPPTIPDVSLSANGKWLLGGAYNTGFDNDSQTPDAVASALVTGISAMEEYQSGTYADGTTPFWYTIIFLSPQLQISVIGKQTDAILALIAPTAPPS